VLPRGICTSVSDLARKLRRYINAYSVHARPIQWKYSDPTRRLRSNELIATGHYVVIKGVRSRNTSVRGIKCREAFARRVNCDSLVFCFSQFRQADCFAIHRTRLRKLFCPS
jgi:hypothetical protein